MLFETRNPFGVSFIKLFLISIKLNLLNTFAFSKNNAFLDGKSFILIPSVNLSPSIIFSSSLPGFSSVKIVSVLFKYLFKSDGIKYLLPLKYECADRYIPGISNTLSYVCFQIPFWKN